jgi:hypothetical protein
MYDDPYDKSHDEPNQETEAPDFGPCDEPPYGSFRGNLEWDQGNIGHVNPLERVSYLQVIDGIADGYCFLEQDPLDCRYRYAFRPGPPEVDFYVDMPIYRLIIDTTRATLRPVTWFPEDYEPSKRRFRQEVKGGNLE